MQLAGLSMAMGAFLAGVMLAESTYRHELEADIEPFRGILLGLFFIAVGMSLDLDVIVANWALILVVVAGHDGAQGAAIFAVCRCSAQPRRCDRIALLLPQGGEFAFVLFTAAAAAASSARRPPRC